MEGDGSESTQGWVSDKNWSRSKSWMKLHSPMHEEIMAQNIYLPSPTGRNSLRASVRVWSQLLGNRAQIARDFITLHFSSMSDGVNNNTLQSTCILYSNINITGRPHRASGEIAEKMKMTFRRRSRWIRDANEERTVRSILVE